MMPWEDRADQDKQEPVISLAVLLTFLAGVIAGSFLAGAIMAWVLQ